MEGDFIGNEGPDQTVELQKLKKKTENTSFKQTVHNSCSN